MTAAAASVWIAPPGPVADGLRIGLLGGSFNPAHEGHLHASTTAMKQLGLDYVWWLVSPQNPLKPRAGMAPLGERLAGARARAIHPRVIVTAIEERLGARYTVDTVAALQHRFPRVRFVWIMGSDNLVQIPRWHRWQTLFRLVPIAVVTRPSSALAARTGQAAQLFSRGFRPPDAYFAERKPPAWTIVEARRNPTSATGLRQALTGS